MRRAFVAGAKWWEWHSTKATMWASDRDLAEAEAERRYPDGQPAQDDDPIGDDLYRHADKPKPARKDDGDAH